MSTAHNAAAPGVSVGDRAVAGAIREDTPVYGGCVYRAFEGALKCAGTEQMLLCECDMTFRTFARFHPEQHARYTDFDPGCPGRGYWEVAEADGHR